MPFVPKETKGNNAKIKNNLAILLVKRKSIDSIIFFKKGMKIIDFSVRIKEKI